LLRNTKKNVRSLIVDNGGVVKAAVSNLTTHIIILGEGVEWDDISHSKQIINAIKNERRKFFCFVSPLWITKSVVFGRLENISDYLLDDVRREFMKRDFNWIPPKDVYYEDGLLKRDSCKFVFPFVVGGEMVLYDTIGGNVSYKIPDNHEKRTFGGGSWGRTDILEDANAFQSKIRSCQVNVLKYKKRIVEELKKTREMRNRLKNEEIEMLLEQEREWSA
jgi:hypothetical protein